MVLIRASMAEDVLCEVRHFVKCVLLEGLLLLCKDLALDEKDQITIYRRGTHEVNFLTELLPSFGKKFDRALADGRFHPVDQFKSNRNNQPVFLGSVLGRIFDRQTGELRDDACVDAIRTVRQVCYYAYKVDFPYSSTKVNAVLSNFVQTERELASFCELQKGVSENGRAGVFKCVRSGQRKTPSHPLAATAAMLVQTVFNGFSAKRLTPKHGPGVTANVALTEKWERPLAVGSPSGPLTKLFWFNESDALDRVNRFPTWDNRSYFRSSLEGNTAKVLLVPKDSRGPRLISAEPAERQFLQQAIKAEITRILESHELTSGHVNFTDQTINQRLASAASKERYWATLDLRDASDRVSLDLVNTLFGETELRDVINHVRSQYTTLPTGEILRLEKHAPMGSALCFPVMAVCIWAISVAYLLGATGSLVYARDSVFVYGDDIICPSDHAAGLSYCLELFGLKVNLDKSFVDSPFAESCGFDAFRGEEVTPVRMRSLWGLFIGDEHSQAKALVSIVEHARQLDRNMYYKAAEYYYSIVEKYLGPLPYATDTSPFLGRFCLPEDWEILSKDWITRNGKQLKGGRKSERLFVGFFPQPVKAYGEDGPWAHLCRTHTMWGRGMTPELGVYDTPKKVKLVKRTYKLNTFACGVHSQPEWVKALDGNA